MPKSYNIEQLSSSPIDSSQQSPPNNSSQQSPTYDASQQLEQVIQVPEQNSENANVQVTSATLGNTNRIKPSDSILPTDQKLGNARDSKVDVVDPTPCKDEEKDPWKVVEFHDDRPKWSQLTTKQKFLRVAAILSKFVIVLTLLYFFICSLDLLGASFQLLGGRTAGQAFKNSELLRNPVCGVMIGVIVTVLLQSSSTSTSIVVTLVGANLLTVDVAIPIVMGANIGTTVTNTIVSLTMTAERDEFRRAFGAATVHDMFNWMTVLVFLPLEAATKYLYRLTGAIVNTIPKAQVENPKILKALTEPLTKLIVQVDKSIFKAIAKHTTEAKWPLLKYWSKTKSTSHSASFVGGLNKTYYDIIDKELWTHKFKIEDESKNGTNYTIFSWKCIHENNSTKASYLFHGQGMEGSSLSEAAVGAILLCISLGLMVFCLIMMVKTLSSLTRGSLANVIRKTLNANFPGKLAFLTGYLAILVGAGMTVIVQSSSVFTSAMTPLVGMGMFTLERMYPLTLGSNIGTTTTGVLAALTATSHFKESVQISLAHLFFNLSGILLFYPIPPIRNIPISLARGLGNTTAKYRWFAIFYLIFMFIALPGILFALSIPGWYVLLGVAGPFFILFVIIIIINVCQNKCPGCLPKTLQSWEFLPRPLRSLEPYDRVIKRAQIGCIKCCPCCKSKVNHEDDKDLEMAGVHISTAEKSITNNGHVNREYANETNSKPIPTTKSVTKDDHDNKQNVNEVSSPPMLATEKNVTNFGHVNKGYDNE